MLDSVLFKLLTLDEGNSVAHKSITIEILCKNGRLIPTAKRGKEIKQR